MSLAGPPTSADETTESHRRRLPQQQRSRDRVEAILRSARELIVEGGGDALKMSEVAARAGVPIGSVYQYFPDKPAIVMELVHRFMERSRAMLVAGLEGLGSKDEAIERLDHMLAEYHRVFIDEPDIREIWSAAQADKHLQQCDIDDSRANGELLANALRPFVARRNRKRLESVSFLFMHLAGSSARLAIAVDASEGERMIVELRRAMRRHLEDLLED